MMKKLLWTIGAILLIVGCGSRQYFEPEVRYDAPVVAHYEGKIVDVSREGVTLDDGRYIDKDGISTIRLGEGFRFLNEDGSYVLASDANGTLKIIDKKTGETVRKEALGFPVVAASVHRGLAAYVLENNAYGLYRIRDGKRLSENRSEPTYAIDARAANPVFVDTLAVMPMLDGKLIVFDVNDPENASVIYLSSERNLNNVIFLARTGDTLVAATPKKLLTIGDVGEYEKRADIADVRVYKGKIHLFTKDGRVEKLTLALDPTAERKFKFAQFVAVDVYDDKVYALDKQGSLIVISLDLKKAKIYDVGEVESPVFMRGGKLYKDGNIIDLTRLSYE
jgi:hypothetical protein